MTELLNRVGSRTRSARKRQGLTIKQLADAAGLSPRFVSELEAGRANIAIGRLEQVAAALSLDLVDLVLDPGGRWGRLGHLLHGRSPAEFARSVEAVELALEAPRPRAIALLGLRGAGKSSLGPQLGEALGLEFVELDARIEQAAGLSLSEVFALHGEAYYRRLERQCLASLIAAPEPTVIALGGGVVTNDEAFKLVQDRCTTVWLKADPEDHMRRVLAQGDRRPVAGSGDAMAELRSILAAREPLYRQARVHVDTSALGEDTLHVLLQRVEASGWVARASTG
ncbi:MAG: helix-turn-helix domain-containing protein [Planctomycetes bacterium]|nr:helix-turn-helix domain-containing protein [Planctomycetota bacterium]